jgi:hypothetical protein
MDSDWQPSLLLRLDTLVNLAVDRHGLALGPDGRLADAEARPLAESLAITSPPGPGERDLDALELLRALAEAIGLLRARGDRLQVTTLHHPWSHLDATLRAGLVYAAWCHRVPWVGMLGHTQERLVRRVRDARGTILLLLHDLPVGVEVDLHGLVVNVSSHLGLPDDTERVLLRVVAAVFLDPLVALGIATVDPPAPAIPTRVRLDASAHHSIGSALIAGGHELASDRPHRTE